MAIPWIKMEVTTPEKPEVFMIASRLGMNPENVFAKCFKVWRWADAHVDRCNESVTPESRESNDASVTSALPMRNNLVTKDIIDLIAGQAGFADAMILAGWLQQGESGLTFPNVDRHLGEGSKTRGLTARRAGKARKKVTVESRESNDASVTSALHQRYQRREEKRREENTSSPTPSSSPSETESPPPPKSSEEDVMGGESKPQPQDPTPSPRTTDPGYNLQHLKPADEVLRHYQTTVRPLQTVSGGQRALIGCLLDGATVAKLKAAASHYAQWCDQQSKDPRYRESAAKFYGDGGWTQFCEKPPDLPTVPPPRGSGGKNNSPATFESRLKDLIASKEPKEQAQ